MNATAEVVHMPLRDSTYRVTMTGNGTPLLLLHGFTGSGDTWTPHFPSFSAHYRVIAVDHLGHGGTSAPADPARYKMEYAARDLLALLDALVPAHRAVHVLGYLMGGRVALHLAVTAPDRVSALVLESASPSIDDPDQRALRAAADDALAARIARDGIAAFVRYWEDLPLFATQRRLPDFVRARQRAQRLDCSAAGLANSLRGMSVGRQTPLHDRLSALPMPVLLVAGALDDKYRVLAESMARRIPRCRVVIVPDTGHAVHLEQPALFEQAVLEFFDQAVRSTYD